LRLSWRSWRLGGWLSPVNFPSRVGKTLDQIITTEGIDSAVAKYRDLKMSQPDAYNFQEEELDRLGNNLLGQKKIKEAIKVFQLNAETYPQSPNVYSSLAEAFLLNGDKALAIENFGKCLKLHPYNTNAAQKLKLLRSQ
jgi:tetratricopeptide (TPR) repeat protein